MSIKESEDTPKTSSEDTIEKEQTQAAFSKDINNDEEDEYEGLC